ncbi:MAG TPA: amidohydrolase family protein [Vicinamibacterales bacterium]
MRVNDSHCHFFSPAFFGALARQKGLTDPSPASAVTALAGWDDPGTVEELADRWRDELDRHQVSRAVLIASVPGDEDSVAAAVARHPARFVGFFMVDPTMEGAPARVREALARPGMRGVCLFPAMHRYPLDDRRAVAVIGEVAATPGAVLFVHCGVLSIGIRKKLGLPSRFELRYGQPLDVQRVAIDHPSLPIIVPHFGAGFFREALMAADACPNIHLDTSSSNGWVRYHPGLTLTEVFRHALAVVGPERLLFGTDSSFFPRGWVSAVRDAQQAVLAELGVPEADRARIFGGNFDRLLPADS